MSFTFELDQEMRERLAELAAACKDSGRGALATANYHGQGAVLVPAQWLGQLLQEASPPPGPPPPPAIPY